MFFAPQAAYIERELAHTGMAKKKNTNKFLCTKSIVEKKLEF